MNPKEIKKLAADIEQTFFDCGSSAGDTLNDINCALSKDNFRGDTRREMLIRIFYCAINAVTCSPSVLLERENSKGALVDFHGRPKPQDLGSLVRWECHVPLDKLGSRPAWTLALYMVGQYAGYFPTDLVQRILETGKALEEGTQ